jgi:hypothetical protein
MNITQRIKRTEFLLQIKEGYIESTEVIALPPSFLIGMKNRFLAHFYPRHYENEIGKWQ